MLVVGAREHLPDFIKQKALTLGDPLREVRDLFFCKGVLRRIHGGITVGKNGYRSVPAHILDPKFLSNHSP